MGHVAFMSKNQQILPNIFFTLGVSLKYFEIISYTRQSKLNKQILISSYTNILTKTTITYLII